MQYSDNSQQAAEYLRQAVPLMVKYKIPPHPLNYALWYTYVTHKLPRLNQDLDQTIKKYGTCPAGLETKLFRSHLISQELGETEKLQAALISVATGLNHSAELAVESTNDFTQLLQESLQALHEADEAPVLETIAQSLYNHTVKVSEATSHFQQRISDAQKEIKRLQEELNATRHDAYTDALTHLYNRRFFDETLIRVCNSTPKPLLALIMLDIDHFKKLNDTYGHMLGDKVLQCLGQIIKEECQESADGVRFGGEEFVILVYEHSQENALALAERIRHKIQAIRVKHKASNSIISSITASFGITIQQAFDVPERMLERVDQALYQAKNTGRNKVVCI
ncbi:GGDEF domain-containing protein [Nitrincola tibetensis]|uniref:diguanylate cyclase n=1 Tax=Nitrincola tibetensis TaxID=2219697 RepID=A0A364NI96_9GAMM|nr:GGDEF domain-containing protein [Nitrincola tibetensis]RAU16796.1 GGDEF domain-containing protein [Nitrincola tibetensis]